MPFVASSLPLISQRPAFQKALHAWYRANHRKLPWRHAPSLYKTVVSEFMLQQTQVATVLPYFERWLRELPDFAALAGATEDRVLKLWEGLGYYSRARNLHRLARTVAALATPPRTPAGWRELPGIGPYTAAAVTSISFGEPAAVVDGNVVRILARLTGERRLFRDGSEAAKFFIPLADALIIGADPGTHNQAMMELGATVCLRQNPRCTICPVAKFCVGRRRGEPEKLPRLKPKRTERLFLIRTFCLYRGALLLRRGHAKAKRLAGLHELPEASDLGVKPTPQTLLAVKRRAITRFQITESIHRVEPTVALLRRIKRDAALEWVPLELLGQVTLSGPHRRWIAEITGEPVS
ncbi:MAG: yfhQ [Lacunisphaera sp.]|nr:yfhQ [Lacunisphaera sp.]